MQCAMFIRSDLLCSHSCKKPFDKLISPALCVTVYNEFHLAATIAYMEQHNDIGSGQFGRKWSGRLVNISLNNKRKYKYSLYGYNLPPMKVGVAPAGTAVNRTDLTSKLKHKS